MSDYRCCSSRPLLFSMDTWLRTSWSEFYCTRTEGESCRVWKWCNLAWVVKWVTAEFKVSIPKQFNRVVSIKFMMTVAVGCAIRDCPWIKCRVWLRFIDKEVRPLKSLHFYSPLAPISDDDKVCFRNQFKRQHHSRVVFCNLDTR